MANILQIVKLEMVALDLPVTLVEQAAKVVEEYEEFTLAQCGKPNLEHLTEEAFDLIQATITYLRKLGVDIESANARHIAKMRSRHE
jgi:phosphoribosyl-ATP pyrophosphohydrolase